MDWMDIVLVVLICIAIVTCLVVGFTNIEYTTTDEQGIKVEGKGPFVFIDTYGSGINLVYHRSTNIVYIYQASSASGDTFTPYQIVNNGAIYGAIYEDGKIIQMPYAMTITPDLISDVLKSGLF